VGVSALVVGSGLLAEDDGSGCASKAGRVAPGITAVYFSADLEAVRVVPVGRDVIAVGFPVADRTILMTVENYGVIKAL